MKKINALEVVYNKNFRNLWLSQLISQTFLNVLIFSQLLHVYSITHSNSAVSVLVLTIGLPNLILGALAGVLVDRWDKKIVMFFCQVIRVVAVLMFILSSGSILWIYTLMILISCVTQFWSPAEVTTIPKIIAGPLLLTANSVFTLTFFSTVILGNILAGPFLAAFGIHGTYLVVAGAFLVASVFASKLPGQSIKNWIFETKSEMLHGTYKFSSDTRIFTELKEEFIEGIEFIRTHRKISKAIFFLAMSQTLIATLSSVAPGFADKVLKIQSVDVSLLIMLPAALGMAVGALMVGQYFVKVNKTKLINLGILVCGVTLIAFSRSDWIASHLFVQAGLVGFIVLIILGAGNAFLDIPANTSLQEGAEEHIRSRVYGVLTALVGGAAVLPVILAGALSDLFGVRLVVLGLGGLVMLVGLLNLRDS